MGAAHLLWAVAQLLLLQNWIAGPAFLVASIPLYVARMPRVVPQIGRSSASAQKIARCSVEFY